MLGPEGLFDLFNSVDDSSGIIRDKLLNIYLDDFICFTYKYLNSEENILQGSNKDFFTKFIINFNKLYNDKERKINEIVEYIVENNIIDRNDIELKTYFKELLYKLKKLKTITNIDDKNFLELVNNFKKFEYKPVRKNSNSLIIKEHIKNFEIMRGQLVKILDELFYLENNYEKYNERILNIINSIHANFYSIVLNKLQIFYEKNHDLLLSLDIMNKLFINNISILLDKLNPLVEEYYEIEDYINKLNQEKEKNIIVLNKNYYEVFRPINELTRRFLADSNKNYKRDILLNIDISKQEIDKCLEINERYEFNDEIDSNSIENIEKSCNEENKEMFKIAVPLAKKQTKIDIKIVLLGKKKSAINDEIMEEITSFFEQVNLIGDNLWELVYSSLDLYFSDKNIKLRSFLIEYNSNKNKENN